MDYIVVVVLEIRINVTVEQRGRATAVSKHRMANKDYCGEMQSANMEDHELT